MIKTYSEAIIQSVWDKGIIVPPYNPSNFRKDKCGAWMDWNEYGNRESKLGWEIDHIIPCSFFNLKDSVEQYMCFRYQNLQPLWQPDNFKKGSKIIK